MRTGGVSLTTTLHVLAAATLALAMALAGCATPNPSVQLPSQLGQSPNPAPSSTATSLTTPRPTPTATPEPTFVTFAFDVENRSRLGVVIRADGDTASLGAWLGLETGQRGTAVLSLAYPSLGIYVEVQGVRQTACSTLAGPLKFAATPFTLVIEDGSTTGTVTLSTRAGASTTPLPQPSNALGGCAG
jgi:hypothetical protein